MSTSTGQTTQTMSNMSINYVDKYVQDRNRNVKNETRPFNLNENQHQIQHKLRLQDRCNLIDETTTNGSNHLSERSKTVQNSRNSSEGTDANNGFTYHKKDQPNRTISEKPRGKNCLPAVLDEGTMRPADVKGSTIFDQNKLDNKHFIHTNCNQLVDHTINDSENVSSDTGNNKHSNTKNNTQKLTNNETNKHTNNDTNKQHLRNNELLFRRIMNMFNKSQLWTTLRYGRSSNGRKRGRFFRKKYKNGYSENLLNSNEVNEVYRSDSFKFERFPKEGRLSGCTGIDGLHAGTEVVPGGRVYAGLSSAFHKISLTDEYSVPVDFVNKITFDPHQSVASPTGDKVDLLDVYCDPQDSKAYLLPGDIPDVKIYTSPDRDYSHPYLINAFLLSNTNLVRNASDVEDIYEDIHNIHRELTSPRIITSPISLPTSPTSPLIEFRTSPYYYSELVSKNNPVSNINIKTSTLTPYKKTGHYRNKGSSQTLRNVNFRTYVPKVASDQLNELHKRFAACDNGKHVGEIKNVTDNRGEDQYSVVNKRNKENFPKRNNENRQPANINNTFVKEVLDQSGDFPAEGDIPPEKPPLIRNLNLINLNSTTSFCKNYTYQETSDEEPRTEGTTSQPTSSVVSPCDSVNLFERLSFENGHHVQITRPSTLSIQQDFETFCGKNVNVCKNKPPLQPKKSQTNRTTFGKVRPRSCESERVTISVKSSFSQNRPKSLETPKFEVDDEFFQTELEKSRSNLKSNQIYFLPSPYTENDFGERIEQIKEEDEEDMSKSRHIYETAFDCKVSKSDDDLDIDEVTHRSLLNLKRPNSSCGFVSSNLSFRKKLVKSKSANLQKLTSLKPKYLASVESLTESLNEVSIKHTPSPDKAFSNITNLPSLSDTTNLTPPSTEPLPPKFSNMNVTMTPKSLKYKLDKPKKVKLSFLHATISKIRAKYSSSDSMTSSSNSLESINSSSSNNSRSNSISSHSSDGASNFSMVHPIRQTKLNILSPISDKSFLEQSSEHDSHKTTVAVIIEDKKPSPDSVSSKNKKRVLQNKNLPNKIDNHQGSDSGISVESKNDLFKDFNHSFEQKSAKKRDQNATSAFQHRDSINSIDIQELPFDMPKLRKKRTCSLQPNAPDAVSPSEPCVTPTQETSSSQPHAIKHDTNVHRLPNSVKEPDITGSQPTDTTSLSNVELGQLPFDMPKLRRKQESQRLLPIEREIARMKDDSNREPEGACYLDNAEPMGGSDQEDKLPFDMPKLRRRMRQQQDQSATNSSQDGQVASTSASFSLRPGPVRPVSLLNPSTSSETDPRTGATISSLRKQANTLSLNLVPSYYNGEPVDDTIPLERQGWYHGSVSRHEAETILRNCNEGSYLVRNSESHRTDYSLSLKSARGFMHMKIQQVPDTGKFVLGQFSSPFDTIPQMIKHYAENRLPILGAEHMCLLHPMIEQLL
uniref:SH2 domain-containing adapter protein D n=2 Tax=Cacopsylla melanoneura TaxID=428564 RepID=A0A8D8WT80_9HEMI